MSSDPLLRFRRSAAQLHALAGIERTIRAADATSRRKYLRDFNIAFQEYSRVLQANSVNRRAESADIILVGDYHALPASQLYTASLVEKLSSAGRSVILAVEAILARDQPVLDEWQRGEIELEELRSRIRFEADWGYDWQPFSELLRRTKSVGARIQGIDCVPRQDMRSIRARDRHAAAKIAGLRASHPGSSVVVLFGESHLAPNHLPLLIRKLRQCDLVLTILQNIDSLYWVSAGEPQDSVDAVEVSDDVLCVFSASPLEKYEHYRLCIDRWAGQRADRIDLTPSFYNLIMSLLRFLNVDGDSMHGPIRSSFLVQQLPEIWCAANDEQLHRLLSYRLRRHTTYVSATLRTEGSCFLPGSNVIVVRDFRMPAAAEQVARSLVCACHPPGAKVPSVEDGFYSRVLESALGFFGSKILCWNRKLSSVSPLDARSRCKQIQRIGESLGCELYAAYVRGDVSKRWLRSLFFKDVSRSGAARRVYEQVFARVSTPRTALRMVS